MLPLIWFHEYNFFHRYIHNLLFRYLTLIYYILCLQQSQNLTKKKLNKIHCGEKWKWIVRGSDFAELILPRGL